MARRDLTEDKVDKIRAGIFTERNEGNERENFQPRISRIGTDVGEGGEHGVLFSIFDFPIRLREGFWTGANGGSGGGTGLFNHGFQGGGFWCNDRRSATRRTGRNDCKHDARAGFVAAVRPLVHFVF
jgi:hypothetical protein